MCLFDVVDVAVGLKGRRGRRAATGPVICLRFAGTLPSAVRILSVTESPSVSLNLHGSRLTRLEAQLNRYYHARSGAQDRSPRVAEGGGRPNRRQRTR